MRHPLRYRFFAGITGAFVLVTLLAWIGQQVHVRIVSQDIGPRQQEEVTVADEFVLSEFKHIQEGMQALALDAVRHVSEYTFSFEGVPSPPLIQEMEALQIPEQSSVSVYDTDMNLIAWKGKSIPMEGDSGAGQSLWKIVRDDEWRTALVLWKPISKGDEIAGHIRITRNLFAKAPVQNSVLRDYDIVDTWKRKTGLDIRVLYGDTTGSSILRSLDGHALGTYEVRPPPEARLIRATEAFYDNLMTLSLALLILWILWGTWRWYREELSVSRLVTFASVLWAGRVAFLYLDVPARYQTGKAPFSPLFDPIHLASAVGGGLMQTIGDLFMSALCVFILGVAVFRYASSRSRSLSRHRNMAWIYLGITILTGLALASILMAVVQASVLDSTLGYTGRSVLVPSSLELIVYGSLVLLVLGTVLIVSANLFRGFSMEPSRICLWFLGMATAGGIVLLHWLQWCSWMLSLGFLVACLYIAVWAVKGSIYDWLAVRRVIPAALGICLLLYPVYYQALDQRKRERVMYAASTFGQSGSPNVSLAVREILEVALQRTQLPEVLLSREDVSDEAERILSGSLLASLGAYDASIAFLSSDGEEIYSAGSAALSPEAVQKLFMELRSGAAPQPGKYMLMEPQLEGNPRHQYAGLAALESGWILVRAQPHVVSEEANTPLLRILLSSGYLDLYEDLSLASYSNERLVHTFGRRFTKYQLDSDVVSDLNRQPSLWRKQSVGGGRSYLTYYLQRGSDTVAARMAIDGPFDHLYYLLRMVAGGLLLGIPFCLVGYAMQWKAGLLPRKRLRYQDKVMNAFFLLGVVAVIPVGIAGYNVVTEENEKAVQSWLRQHLERVESTLVPDGRLGENSASALERSSIDSLSMRVGLDLNLYRDTRLVAASRRQLVNDHIVDVRLPAEVFRAIYGDSERFTFMEHRLGDFEYTAGYRAILDTNGEPVYVLSVPNLPEAERIEEERTRTLAYLFGAMLGLGILVVFTASVLARALAQPISRLQQGLKEAAQGKFERVLPVRSRDEVGELVTTFNVMQEQLSESRQKLATQERQLAWREMARQIAHEIKNPLTPMKLAIQHLQRSFWNRNDSRFRKQFQRTTETLIAQIDSLAYIANEFSSFARLPRRNVVRLDLRTVLREAHALMQAEVSEKITLDMQLPDTPLPAREDPSELRRMYINLIKNAMEAVEEQEKGKITITGRQEGDQIVTEVIDNGRGIPPEMHGRIFEPNFSTKTSGAGLGLAIAKRAVELSGGDIRFTTEPGKGTKMRITLPADQEE